MISFLRFPLIVLIVCIHGNMFSCAGQPRICEFISYALAGVISRIAVPLLFLISGLLFFWNCDFSASTDKEKLKRRVKSLLIPYLIWNAAVLLFIIVPNPERLGASNDPLSILSAFIACNGSKGPISIQFWYIRDLMVMNLLSPIVYYSVSSRRFSNVVIILLLLIWIIIGRDSIGYFNPVSVTFYSLGAWIATKKTDLASLTEKMGRLPYAHPALIVLDILCKEAEFYPIIHNIVILFGMAFALRTAYCIVRQKDFKQNNFLVSSSFFVFAAHDPWCFSILRRAIGMIGFHGLSAYLSIIILSVYLSLAAYYVLSRFCQKIVMVLTGNRG